MTHAWVRSGGDWKLAHPPLPGAPEVRYPLAATRGDRVVVSWDAVPHAAYWLVQRRAAPGPWLARQGLADENGEAGYSERLDVAGDIEYRVAGWNAAGRGPWGAGGALSVSRPELAATFTMMTGRRLLPAGCSGVPPLSRETVGYNRAMGIGGWWSAGPAVDGLYTAREGDGAWRMYLTTAADVFRIALRGRFDIEVSTPGPGHLLQSGVAPFESGRAWSGTIHYRE